MNQIPSVQTSMMAQRAQQMPPGMTPPLELLLAMQAQVDAQKKVEMLKASMMGTQPTVMQTLEQQTQQTQQTPQPESVGSSRPMIAQKLGGLQAIAQQQAPQGAPTMPAPPAQPTQHMAAGGLTKLRSNLPGNYAGGGIVAFDDGGDVADKDAPLTMAELWEKIKAHAAGPGLADKLRANLTAPLREYLATDPAVRAAYSAQRETPADVAAQQATAAIPADHIPTYAAPKAVKPNANVPASGQRQSAGLADVLGAAPAASAANNENDAWVWNKAKELGNVNPDAVEKASREDIASRMQTAYGPEQAALIAARKQDYEQAKAAQAARDAKGELSIWDRLGTLGQNAAYGNWGRAAGQQRNMELAHEATKAEGAKGLLALKQAADAMALADKKEAFGTAETKGAAERKQAQAQQLAGLQSGTSLRDTDVRALATKQAAWDAAQARILTAQTAAQARNDAKAAGADTKALALMAASQNNAMRNAEKQAEAAAKNVVKGMDVDVPTLTLKLYNDYLAQDPVYKQVMSQLGIPTSTAPAAKTRIKFDAKGNLIP